jgi:hypothetical protein
MNDPLSNEELVTLTQRIHDIMPKDTAFITLLMPKDASYALVQPGRLIQVLTTVPPEAAARALAAVSEKMNSKAPPTAVRLDQPGPGRN